MKENEYIDKVLACLPRATPLRAQIALELRGHIAERMSQGQSLEEAVAQLGDPATLAGSYLSAVPLEPAPYLPRIAAKLVDMGAVIAIGSLFVLIAWLVLPEEMLPFAAGAAVVACGLGFLVYTITAEHRKGQTIGKRLAGLQVVTESGTPISLGQSIVRQLPMALQILWIDAFFALFTDRRQRAFEMLSKTRVVSASAQSASEAAQGTMGLGSLGSY